MANIDTRFLKFTAILWLSVWFSPAGAAVVGHYEECDQEGQTWSFPAIEASGHTPKILTDLTRADLAGIDVLFVTNCSVIAHFDEFKSRVQEIESAVRDGLVLVMHDREVDQAATVLPGPGKQFKAFWNPSIDTQVRNDSTLVTNGPAGSIVDSSLDGSHAASHGYVDTNSFPSGVTSILSQAEANRSTLMTYSHGLGHVVYSTIPIDFFLRFVPYCIRYQEPIRTACMDFANVYAPNVIAFSAELALRAPTAKVSGDVTTNEGQSVTLDGSASADPQNSSLSFKWTQVSPAQPNNLLNSSSNANPIFYAPYLSTNQVFTYQLVVTNTRGLSSEPAYLNVTVKNSNTPPVADAGNDFAIKAGVMVSLDGSQSYDVDNDPNLTFKWTQVEGSNVSLSDSATVSPSFVVPAAVGQTLAFELQVSDGQESSTTDFVRLTILDNAVPIADAGLDIVKDEASIVVLSASKSRDSDGDEIEYEWQQVSGTPVTLERSLSISPTFKAPIVSTGGLDLVFEVTVTDTDKLNPKAAVDQVFVHVRNSNDPPSCDLAQPSKEMLWPPNHKMEAISINGITDEDSLYNQVSLSITGITQDEPVDAKGDGHTSPDGVIQLSIPNNAALIRAERMSKGNGRVYQINFEASDGLESCTGSVNVGVPKSRKHHKNGHKHLKSKGKKYDKEHGHRHHRHNHKEQWVPVDDGQLYDATEQVIKKKHGHEKHHELNNKLKALLKSFQNKSRNEGHNDKAKTGKNIDKDAKKSISKKRD